MILSRLEVNQLKRREILYEFQIKFDKLISNVNNLIDDIDEAIKHFDGEINKSLNISSESDLEKINIKRGEMMDLKMVLTGTRSLNYADVFSGSPPSVQKEIR